MYEISWKFLWIQFAWISLFQHLLLQIIYKLPSQKQIRIIQIIHTDHHSRTVLFNWADNLVLHRQYKTWQVVCETIRKLPSFLGRWNFSLVARCWLLFARCWLLFAHCSLLFAHCSLLFAHCWLLFARCWLLFAHCSLLFICSLLVTICSLVFTFYSLLDKKFWRIFFGKVNKRFSISICTNV